MPRRPSRSSPTPSMRPSSARSTAGPSRTARRRSPPRRSPTGRTSSPCGRSATPRRPSARSPSTPPRPRRRSRPAPRASSPRPRATSSSPARPPRGSSAGSWRRPSPLATPPALASVAGPGDYEFQVRAIDPAGNVDPSPAARAFELRPPLPAGQPPRNVEPPTIHAGVVARVYTCTPGEWENVAANQAYEYRWYRAYSFAPHVLVGTGSSYTVPQAYVGFTFYCVVTAQNAFGSGTGYSKWGILSGLPVRAGRVQGRRLRQRRACAGSTSSRPSSRTPARQDVRLPQRCVPRRCAGGGTPTSFRPRGSLVGPRQRVALRQGVLARRRQAGDRDRLREHDRRQRRRARPSPLEVRLRVLRGGSTITTQTALILNPPVSASPWVTLAERDDPKMGVQFPVPAFALAGGDIDFEATSASRSSARHSASTSATAAAAAPTTRSGSTACRSSGCRRSRSWASSCTAAASRRVKNIDIKNKTPFDATADNVLEVARRLWPGGEGFNIPTVARLDVGDEENYKLDDDQCDDIDAEDRALLPAVLPATGARLAHGRPGGQGRGRRLPRDVRVLRLPGRAGLGEHDLLRDLGRHGTRTSAPRRCSSPTPAPSGAR